MKQVNLLLMSAAMTLASCGGTKDAGQQQDAATLIQRIPRRKANCLHGILLQRAPEQE